MSDSLGLHMRAEIAEQTEIVARWSDSQGYLDARARSWVQGTRPSAVLTFAHGTSENAAGFGRYLLAQYARIPGFPTDMSQLGLAQGLPCVSPSLAVGISQSGQSPDLALVANAYRDRGIPVLGVVNDAASPLATTCDVVVDIAVGTERAVAATKSFLAQCLAMLDLVDVLGHESVQRDAISKAVERACGPLESVGIQESTDAISAAFTEHAGLVITTRGPVFSIAKEGALKIMETCAKPVSVFSTADLEHGPVAVVGPRTAVVVLVPGGRFQQPVLASAERIQHRSSRLITVGTGTVPGSYLHVPLVEEDPNALTMAFAVWLQRLTLELATGLGFDPDAPHGLEKVTRTW